MGTVRARIGVAPGEGRMLVYATGGMAYGEVNSSMQYSLRGCVDFGCTPIPGFAGPTSASGAMSGTMVGWTAGGGIEWKIDPRWSVKAEYLFYDLGTATYGLTSTVTFLGFTGGTHTATVNTAASAKFDGNIARIGVNYKLDWSTLHGG